MSRFILIILAFIAVALIVTGIVVNQIPPELSTRPQTTDPISCSCKIPTDQYELIAKGVITDIKYVPIITQAGTLHHTDITFCVDRKPMTLNYDKTHSDNSPYGFYSEIYGADASGNIDSGKYYYIYNYGDRIIWAQAPKSK
jgi:hypothetical protein